MRDGKIQLVVLAAVVQWLDVINVMVLHVQIKHITADKALAPLLFKQFLAERRTLFR